MGIGSESVGSFFGGWATTGRPCDTCKSVAAAVFCRADSLFLCFTCDARIHCSTRHERVLVCEVCEHAPAAVTCKADAAALCVTCDADIHSANPLARRHDRVPVEPFFDSAVAKPSASAFSPFGNFTSPATADFLAAAAHPEDLGLCSWLIPNDFNENSKINNETEVEMKPSDFVCSDFDRLIDFEYHNSFHQPNKSAGADSVVPVQTKPSPVPITNSENCFDIDFCRSKLSAFSHNASSLDFGVVPEGSTSVSEVSIAFSRNANAVGSTETGGDKMSRGATNQQPQVSGMDREARVSRYREKRKNRKFEKTIRYASRKAYAESRPRIKGRFAKRTEAENDDVFVSHVYASPAQYGVVPTF